MEIWKNYLKIGMIGNTMNLQALLSVTEYIDVFMCTVYCVLGCADIF